MLRPEPNLKRGGTRSGWGTVALLAVPVLCCAGPALLGATALTATLGAIGAWLLKPVAARRRRRRGRGPGMRLRHRPSPPATPRISLTDPHRPTRSVDPDRSPIQHQER